MLFVAMFITPPDAISMVMLAIPMWLLFELGLLFGKFLRKEKPILLNKMISKEQPEPTSSGFFM